MWETAITIVGHSFTCGKRVFEDVINLRFFKPGDYSTFLGRLNVIIRVLIRNREKDQNQEGYVRRGAESD